MFLLLTALATWLPPDPLRVDLPRFPDLETACRAVEANRRHREYLLRLGQFRLDRRDDLRDCLDATEAAHRPWDALADAHNPAASDRCRRCHLARLRRLIGEEEYYRGWMPWPVPLP